jgi:hypothetical protein
MTTLVNIKDFLKTIKIIHNNSINDFSDGLRFLIETTSDCVTYYTQKKIIINNITSLEINNDNKYIYEYSIQRDNDIIDDIAVTSSNKDFEVKYVISGIEYNKINTFISAISMYSEFKLKLIFTELKQNDIIYINYRNYLLNTHLRTDLMKTNIVVTDTCICNNYIRFH